MFQSIFSVITLNLCDYFIILLKWCNKQLWNHCLSARRYDMETQSLLEKIRVNITRVLVGHQDAIDLLLIALLSQGHVLIEDVPGVGKTTLAQAFARSLDLSFRRIQFTPDVLPSDITGYHLYDLKENRMTFQ